MIEPALTSGNKYRLVVVVKYQWRMIYIHLIGTHGEYDEYDEINRTRGLESI